MENINEYKQEQQIGIMPTFIEMQEIHSKSKYCSATDKYEFSHYEQNSIVINPSNIMCIEECPDYGQGAYCIILSSHSGKESCRYVYILPETYEHLKKIIPVTII